MNTILTRRPLVLAILTLAVASNLAVAQDAADTSRAGPDGPYVRRLAKGQFESRRVVGDAEGARVEAKELPADAASFELTMPGMAKPFHVALRPLATAGPCELPAVDRLFVVSDIEGNLEALLRLLSAGGVIDGDGRWQFGKGQLVFLGDMFDRGLHVTDCLWLLYELEARAAAAGGAVHFVLGNHEVMNLVGDLRYVRRKYHENAALFGEAIPALYGMDTVLGQWLRTRPVALRIGDELFVHAGVAPAVVRAKATIEALNDALHTGLAAERWTKPKEGLLRLAAGSDSLIWYRGYFDDPVITDTELDEVLAGMKVRRIVVGHTVVDDIGFRFGDRVLAVDVRHARGTSQAALRDGGAWHRLAADGTRKRL